MGKKKEKKFEVHAISFKKGLGPAARKLERALNRATRMQATIEFVQNIDNRGYMVLLRKPVVAEEASAEEAAEEMGSPMLSLRDLLGGVALRKAAGVLTGTTQDLPERVNAVMKQWLKEGTLGAAEKVQEESLYTALAHTYAKEPRNVLEEDHQRVTGCRKVHEENCGASDCEFHAALVTLDTTMQRLMQDRLS